MDCCFSISSLVICLPYLQRYFSDCSLSILLIAVGNPGMMIFCSSPQRLLRFLLGVESAAAELGEPD